MFIYDKEGNKILCDNEQVENMLESGYTIEKPISKSKKTADKEEVKSTPKKKPKKDIIL